MSPERRPIPTDQAEALKSFVEGRDRFRVYLRSGTSGELENASRLFEEATKDDPKFDLAVFYHALTRTELRDSDTAISELKGLVNKGVEFLPEVYLHLAYAHTKNYCDKELYDAEKALDRATVEARKSGEKTIRPVIQAYRVFLYSVMGGRLKSVDIQKKKAYINKAILLGRWNLLKRLGRRDLIRLELHNALGIAYMRKGEVSEAFSERQKRCWGAANRHYREALGLGLNPVRVRQNMGTLLSIQGDQYRERKPVGDQDKAKEYYRKAVEEYQASIDVNPLDQFPHYALARLYVRLDQWDLAQERLIYGRLQKGAVPPASWEKVEKAVALKTASILDERNAP